MFTDLLERLGELGTVGLCLAVAFLAFSETAILLDLAVPGEVGLVLAGAAAAHGDHPVVAVMLAGAAGATAGDSVSYLVGRRWGRAVIERFAFTRRRVLPLVDGAEEHFHRHGGRSVFLARWVGALRAVVPFVAGIGRLRAPTFVAWNVLASLGWASVVVLLGYWLGEPVAGAVDRVGLALSVLVVAALGFAWWRRRRAGGR